VREDRVALFDRTVDRANAAQAALGRIDTLAAERHLPEDRVACLRGLFESRIASIRDEVSPSGAYRVRADLTDELATVG